MSSYSVAAAPAPARTSVFVDETREGSTWQQVATGVAGIILAVTLIVGQVSVATSKGIQQNLHSNVQELRDGNETLRSIVEKAGPTIVMEKVVARQEAALEDTLQTMQVLNGAMGEMGGTTRDLQKTVSDMQQTGHQLNTNVASMDTKTSQIATLLGPVPAKTDATHKQLSRIEADSAAINVELRAIAAKLQKYGLQPAKGAKR